MSTTERIDRPADSELLPMPTDSNEQPAGFAPGKIVAFHSERSEPRRSIPAAEPPERSAKQAAGREKAGRSPRPRWQRWGPFALLPLALIGGGYWYVTGGQVMSTDDAYVEADKVGISTDVSGIVEDVDVTENQQVKVGQVLYRLDPRQFQIALDHAKATLANTRLTIENLKASYRTALNNIASQQAVVADGQATFDRFSALIKGQLAISKAQYDQARYALDADKQKLASLEQQAQAQLALLDGDPDIPAEQHPQYLQAKGDVDEAQRQLDHTVIKAPFAGMATGVPSIAPGKYLQASMTAFYLVSTDHVWVDANPKETELTYVQRGQPVTVTVDTYPDLEWRGTVESISPAAAQEFALLPAQNTSGNWVKVVQRIPMRVRVDTSDNSRPPLRAGMSVEVDVDTGHARGLPHFLTALFG
jgi:membrane fusion protein, multidrug efflux system